MDTIYYIGLDIHKKTIAYCVKRFDGVLIRQGTVFAQRRDLLKWLSGLPGHWIGAMEATMFTGWVYDFLKPHALELKVAHPEMLKAITATSSWMAPGPLTNPAMTNPPSAPSDDLRLTESTTAVPPDR